MPLQDKSVDVLASAATQLVEPNKRRNLLIITNTGPNAIHVGSSTVDTTKGVPVAATTGQLTISKEGNGEAVQEAWYARAATADQAGTADTRILEGIG